LMNETKVLPGSAGVAEIVMKSLAGAGAEAHARAAVERLAQLAAAAALASSSPSAVAEAFARTRLAAAPGASFGTSGLDTADIAVLLDRALP
jgi:putative acyl-CoA dehydrogenase